jgi:hypothetical protein
MKNEKIKLGVIIVLSYLLINPETPPQHKISNKLITANLYLPDTAIGYYRATRFDWAGLIPSLEYKGHSFFGQWFENYNPKTHDAVIGPVESFAPLGFEEAKPGGRFVMIGIGALRRPSLRAYSSFNLYEMIDPGKWTVKRKKDRVEFVQELQDSTGFGYIYTKTVILAKGKPRLTLRHSLRNTGTRPIESEVFDHNFPVIDNQLTGPEMRVVFPFNVKAEGRGWGTLAKTDGKEIVFLKGIEKRDQVYSPGLQTLDNAPLTYDIKVQNQKTGAGMRITSDQPLSKLVFWACTTTVCPEPYIKVKVAPGAEMKWDINYEFYTFSPEAQK